MLRKLDLPPVWFALSISALWLGAQAGWALTVPFGHALGAALTILGAALVFWAALWFLKKRTPIEPGHTPNALVVEGPFRLSRNPIYLAMILISLAATLWTGSLIGIGTTILLWWILQVRFVTKEEAVLRQVFGPEADTFFQATRRWI